MIVIRSRDRRKVALREVTELRGRDPSRGQSPDLNRGLDLGLNPGQNRDRNQGLNRDQSPGQNHDRNPGQNQDLNQGQDPAPVQDRILDLGQALVHLRRLEKTLIRLKSFFRSFFRCLYASY